MKEYQRINKERLAKANEAYKKGIEYYKEQAESHRKQRKYGQDFSFTLYRRIKEYLERLEDNGKPITIAGLILASGMTQKSWYELKNGEYDHDLYLFMDTHDCSEVYEYDSMPCCDVDGERILLVPMSEIIEKAVLLKEEETETRLYEKGRVGDIFALKAKHGWVEEEKAPHTVNQTLVIASETDARKALEMLK